MICLPYLSVPGKMKFTVWFEGTHVGPPSYTMYCMYFNSVFDNILLLTVADHYQIHINKERLIKFSRFVL